LLVLAKCECEISTKSQKEATLPAKRAAPYISYNKTKGTASWITGTVLTVDGVGNTSHQVRTLGQIMASVLSLDIDEIRESDAGHW
jgi:hypothetical protein